MSSNSSLGAQSPDPHPYSYESAVEPPAAQPQRELNPDEVAAAAAWASTLNEDDDPGYADPYSAYADPYGQPYGTPPYPPAGSPYADAYGPIPGQRPAAGPYVQNNPYAVMPAQSYGHYTPYGRPLMNHPSAVPAMVVSIISWFLCPLAGAIGMFMGISSLNAINREPDRYTGKGMAITGIVMGAIASIGSLFFFFVFFMAGVMG